VPDEPPVANPDAEIVTSPISDEGANQSNIQTPDTPRVLCWIKLPFCSIPVELLFVFKLPADEFPLCTPT